MTFHRITIEGFEGPLDLLLELIEKEKLDVSRISLASVTDQYLDLLGQADHLSSEELAEFLVVASRLILIKSRRLFPQFALTDEEEEDAALLEEQLREYQRYRNAARSLSEQWAKGPLSFARVGYIQIPSAFYPPSGFDISNIRHAYSALIETLPTPTRAKEEITRRIVTLEEKIHDLQRRIEETVVTSFREHVARSENKTDVVVSFLALLQLIKRRLVDVEQKDAFQDILIRRKESQE